MESNRQESSLDVDPSNPLAGVKQPGPFYTVKTRARAQKIARALFGPCARTWVRDGKFAVGTEYGQDSEIFAWGTTWEEVLEESLRYHGFDSFEAFQAARGT